MNKLEDNSSQEVMVSDRTYVVSIKYTEVIRMHILVLIKQVPETDKVKMDPETGTMVRSGLEST